MNNTAAKPPFNHQFLNQRSMFKIAAIILVIALTFTMAACSSTSQTTGNANPGSNAATTGQTSKAATASVVKVTADEALKILKDNSVAVLLDVRTEAEYAEGHIENSQLLPVEELSSRTGELPQDKATPIIVYCRSGRRSALAAAQLLELGYSQVFDLGGIQSWPYDIVK